MAGWNNYPNAMQYDDAPVDPHKGWTISKDQESGLQFIYRPDGSKYGQTQTEAGAMIMRRRAIQRADEEARILGERETQSDRDAWYDLDS